MPSRTFGSRLVLASITSARVFPPPLGIGQSPGERGSLFGRRGPPGRSTRAIVLWCSATQSSRFFRSAARVSSASCSNCRPARTVRQLGAARVSPSNGPLGSWEVVTLRRRCGHGPWGALPRQKAPGRPYHQWMDIHARWARKSMSRWARPDLPATSQKRSEGCGTLTARSRGRPQCAAASSPRRNPPPG